jgi:hypothetical protein
MKPAPPPAKNPRPDTSREAAPADSNPEGSRAEPASREHLRLSEEITDLIRSFTNRTVRLREVIEVLRGRAYTLLLLLLALPFCTPIPMPGVSLPFGLVIAVIGFRLALRQKPWLPQRLLDTQLPPKFFARLLEATRRLSRVLEVVLRPRWSYLLDAKWPHHGYGAIIFVCGLLLVVPLPIPFSNGLPAFTVVLLACAILERDGYCLGAGLLMFVLTLCFFGVIFWGGAEGVAWLREAFRGILAPDDVPAP